MKGNRGECWFKRDFIYYDIGIIPLMGSTLLHLYDILRTHLWRKGESRLPAVNAAFKAGFLVTQISQARLGEELGVSRKTINELLKELQIIGWAVPHTSTGVDVLLYQLGEIPKDAMGGSHETLHADAWLERVNDAVEAEEDRRAAARLPKLEFFERQEIAATFIPLPRAKESLARCRELRREREKEKAKKAEFSEASGWVRQHPDAGCNLTTQSGVPTAAGTAACNLGLHPEVSSGLHGNREEGIEKIRIEKISLRDDAERRETEEAPVPDVASALRCNPDNSAHAAMQGEEPDRTDVLPVEERVKTLVGKVEETTAMAAAWKAARKLRQEQTNSLRKRETALGNLEGGRPTIKLSRALRALEELWRGRLRALVGEKVPIGEWTPKDRSLMKKLIESYKGPEPVRVAVEFFFDAWSRIKERLRLDVPSVQTLYSFSEKIFLWAYKWQEYLPAIDQFDVWCKNHPGERPPTELSRRAEEAKARVEAMFGGPLKKEA